MQEINHHLLALMIEELEIRCGKVQFIKIRLSVFPSIFKKQKCRFSELLVFRVPTAMKALFVELLNGGMDTNAAQKMNVW